MAVNIAFNLLRECLPTLSVGITSADFLNIGREVELLESTDIKLMHFDVMDGCFVERLTVGPVFIKAIKTNLLKDVNNFLNSAESLKESIDEEIKIHSRD